MARSIGIIVPETDHKISFFNHLDISFEIIARRRRKVAYRKTLKLYFIQFIPFLSELVSTVRTTTLDDYELERKLRL
jgi:hypothetical protein